LATELQNLGHEVEIFTLASDESSYPELFNKVKVSVVRNPLADIIPQFGRLGKRLAGLVQYYTTDIPSMYRLARAIPKRFDIINNHNPPTEWASFFAKKRLNVPVVWMCNEPPFWFFEVEHRRRFKTLNWPVFELLDKISVRYVDRVMVLSSIAAGYVRAAYHTSATIIRSGVDIDLLHRASGQEIRKKHGLEDDFVLLQVGNIERNKGQGFSIKLLHRLSRCYDNLKLIIDGGGSTVKLEQLCEKLGVRDRVLFLHTGSDDQLAQVYAACDAFLFPAHITWGLAVIEAMAAGKPVVVSRFCGASEIIQNGLTGIVVENDKLDEWTLHVKSLIDDPALRSELGMNAFRYVSDNFSWRRYAADMANIFRQEITRFRKN